MIKFCILSFIFTRVFYISLIVCAYSFFLGRYEQSNELIQIDSHNNSAVEKLLLSFFKHFYSYDSVHFIQIAKNSYTSDNNYAFFPLFPGMIRYLAQILELIFSGKVVNIDTYYLLSGFVISNLLCFCNCILFYRLSFFLTNSEVKAKFTTFLFLINPGTVFFITIYSENLFLALELLFILMCLTNSHINSFLSFMVFVVILIACRSTALITCIYLGIPIILNILVSMDKKYESDRFYTNFLKVFKNLKNNLPHLGKIVLIMAHCVICFLWMTKLRPTTDICSSIPLNMKFNSDYSDNYNKIVDEYKVMCFNTTDLSDNSKTVIKLNANIYSHVQKKYWDVSFFSQYTVEKVDRILLALPMNILALVMIVNIFKYFNFNFLFKLKLDKFFFYEKCCENESQENHLHSENTHTHQHSKRDLYYNTFIFVSFLHFLVNFFIVVFIAHPQINNRVYPTCPILFFYCADEVVTFCISKKTHKTGLYILIFFTVFSILGCIMQTGGYGFA